MRSGTPTFEDRRTGPPAGRGVGLGQEDQQPRPRPAPHGGPGGVADGTEEAAAVGLDDDSETTRGPDQHGGQGRPARTNGPERRPPLAVEDLPDRLRPEPEPETDGVGVSEIRALLDRQEFRCAYTGDELTPENTGVDHVVPVSRGGSHGADNLALVVQAVNSAKGSMTIKEFVTMCRKVVRVFGADGPVVFKG